MSQQPANNQTSGQPPGFPAGLVTVVLLILFITTVVARFCLQDSGLEVLVAVIGLFLVVSFIMLFGADETIQQKKQSRRDHRRHLTRTKEAAYLESQLQKPDFETRLRSFTKVNDDGNSEAEEAPESQMEFWEREQEYSRTPSRPVELIRHLLQQIAKLVGGR